jgi:UTP-glucose-1-phosphate uridylyltransferase
MDDQPRKAVFPVAGLGTRFLPATKATAKQKGRRFDCRDKVGFLEAQMAFALKRPELADAVRDFLRNYA